MGRRRPLPAVQERHVVHVQAHEAGRLACLLADVASASSGIWCRRGRFGVQPGGAWRPTFPHHPLLPGVGSVVHCIVAFRGCAYGSEGSHRTPARSRIEGLGAWSPSGVGGAWANILCRLASASAGVLRRRPADFQRLSGPNSTASGMPFWASHLLSWVHGSRLRLGVEWAVGRRPWRGSGCIPPPRVRRRDRLFHSVLPLALRIKFT